MKRILFTLMATLFCVASLHAQTTEEILQKMSEAMDFDNEKGIIMTMDIKMPILGTYSTRAYTKGDRSRMEMTIKGKKVTTWVDGTVSYAYDPEDNTLTIEDVKQDGKKSDGSDNLSITKNVAEGYDVKLVKETDQYWSFLCTKRKDNTNKDDPKKMDLSVWKGSYMLKESSATMKGVTVRMRDIVLGVDDKDVTFDMSKFAGAKIEDKRAEK